MGYTSSFDITSNLSNYSNTSYCIRSKEEMYLSANFRPIFAPFMGWFEKLNRHNFIRCVASRRCFRGPGCHRSLKDLDVRDMTPKIGVKIRSKSKQLFAWRFEKLWFSAEQSVMQKIRGSKGSGGWPNIIFLGDFRVI